MSFMITRDNYEEFFLLYVDNELSAPERQLVEDWVAENPDLTEEWRLLLQCRLAPDHLVFMDTASLFRQENDLTAGNNAVFALDQTNDANPMGHAGQTHHADLLSYIDGELKEDARMSVEELLLRNPSLRAELAALQRTVSAPDPAIVFENKQLLYRKEKERRIVFFPWRMAAAALVAGVVGLLIFNTFHKGPGASVAIAPTATPSADRSGPARSQDTDHAVSPPDSARKELIALAKLADSKISSGKKVEPTVTRRSSSALHLSEAGQSDGTAGAGKAAGQKHSPGVGKQEEDPADKILAQTDPLTPAKTSGIDQQLARTVTSGVDGDGPMNKTGVVAIPAASHPTIRTKENSFATEALLSSSGGSPDDGLVMEDSPLKKHKLRGLFRKVTRVLEKTTSRDEDDHRSVLVGSFQFALK